MNKIYAEERQRTLRLRKQVKQLIYNELKTNMNPHWFISFHYTDNKTNEDEALKDVADLKIKSAESPIRIVIDRSRKLDHSLIQKCCSLMNRVI